MSLEPAPRGGPHWREATIVRIEQRTPSIKSFFLDVPGLAPFRAGQHLDVHLVAEDGYEARRSYSIASRPGDGVIELMVDRLPDGEVSPWFHDVAQPGDTLEVLGPVGGHFVWEPSHGGPLLLVAGGSGIVPLLSMLRARASMTAEARPPACLVYGARHASDLACRDELVALADADAGLTLRFATSRDEPTRAEDYGRRIDQAMLTDVLAHWHTPALSYICGSTGLVENVASLLVELGLPAPSIRTERYGGMSTAA